ncbi:hypothetical protein TWF569_010891 [Orbilia oligospora]|uniref:Uncharacterized protein n=1 Tax=Orbilia oligospora TaxID=2813651 RepID=A0A7C8NNR0_ORBOL|nr:hypothetical protein TWF103_001470 [Orbilia oligospora]KAF3091528.1 hypothetical protein TWF706_009505 [Orbilia oligospora]KAF3098156.1 hypothetical protein TWF102_006147 [Orbilia oligospora]KAF3132611.1 hypothetical protein TWF569_010891 [Orbilia oligospora]KAF3132754.1 hypothetical protein TWF703_007220 [Orbilia oligospora]
MKFLAIAAVALGFAGSALAAPPPPCKTPAVFTITTKLSPIHVVYAKIIPEVTRVPCGAGCPLQIITVTVTHRKWNGSATRTITRPEKHTPVPMCEVIVSVPELAKAAETGKEKDD